MKKCLNLDSLRVKIFLIFSAIIIVVIGFLLISNNFVLEKFYVYTQTNVIKQAYIKVDEYLQGKTDMDLNAELEKISAKNNFDIIIKDEKNSNIYINSKDFSIYNNNIYQIENRFRINPESIVEEGHNYIIQKYKDKVNAFTYITLFAQLENEFLIYIRVPLNSIEESVNISNKFLFAVASIAFILAGIIITIVSKKITNPIVEIRDVAKRMSNLDFSKKYHVKKSNDEVNELGISINVMSDKLENTIKQLRTTNTELEKDIKEKYNIDEMRKSFISDVSHELKTPIALIQAYSEGLVESVNDSEQDRKYYADVILDETNKMDKLVKQLLQLMKLEYEKREFNDKEFDIVELQKEIIRKTTQLAKEKDVGIKFVSDNIINVYADDFYIDQVFSNYLTNAIKYIKEIEGSREIIVSNIINKQNNTVCIEVFNNGNTFNEDEIDKLFDRFYKIDESRNRNNGGSGIGLSLVKAIMQNYDNAFGVRNEKNGVTFYFELKTCNK